MSEKIEDCSIGINLKEECHKTIYTAKVGFVNSFTEEEFELIKWRSGIDDLEFTLCYHHKETILNRFTKQQTNCCDPFGDHTNTKRSTKRKKSK